MNTRHAILIFTSLAFLAILLGACAPAAAPSDISKEAIKTEAPAVEATEEPEAPAEVVGEGEQISTPADDMGFAPPEMTGEALPPSKVEGTPAQPPPAAEEPAAPAPPQATPPPTATSARASPTPPTTAPEQVPTDTPIIEQRAVEVEWPTRMRLGESDVVRLALIPSEEGYTLTTEYPEHQTITQTINVPRPGGYYLYAIGRLDGVGFDISPGGDQVQYLQPGEALTWRWSFKPRDSGPQRLSIALKLRWEPMGENRAPAREVSAYSTALDVQVLSFLGLTQSQAMLGGAFGLVLGCSLGLVALTARPRTPRRSPATLLQQVPNRDLAIELPSGLSLSLQERELLQTLFKRYGRLVVESEFLSGYSGARTFLTLPVRPDGRTDAHTIAKLGEKTAIQREFENYEAFVKNTLPPITARIQQPPVASAARPARSAQPGIPFKSLKLAALQYTFIGEAGRAPTGLRQALLADPDPSLLFKLLDTFGPNWWLQRSPYTFRLAKEYDRVLPTHLVLEPAKGDGRVLDGQQPPAALNVNVGDIITLQNVVVEELRADGRSLSLQGQGAEGHPPLRVRWLSLERPLGAAGRVVANRWTLLRQYTEGCDLLGLPDPFERLPALLGETISGSRSTIHGDLNLENILLGPGELVWLIDFAQTREGHTLYDFAHLEAEIIAHILAPQIPSAAEYLAVLHDPDKSPYKRLYALRTAVLEIAGRCLFNPDQPREYKLASTLACLGALKFRNLDRHARHLLYLTAAYQMREL